MTRLFRRRRWIAVVLGGVVVIATLWARHYASDARDQASAARARKENLPIPVRTTLVSEEAVDTVIGATALSVPSEQITIMVGTSLQLSHRNLKITAIHVNDGDFIEAGQTLFELAIPEFEQSVTHRKAALAAASANLASAETAEKENVKTRHVELEQSTVMVEFRRTAVQYYKEVYETLTRLREEGQAQSRETLEAAADYAEAQAELSDAETRLQTAKAEMVLGPTKDKYAVLQANALVEEGLSLLHATESDLEQCRIISPLAGYVEAVTAVKGQSVQAGEHVAKVLRVDPIHVKVDFPQERLTEVAVGQAVDVVLDAYKQQEFSGRVLRIAPRVDEQLRVLAVIVEIANQDRRIKPGVSGYARIHVSRPTTTVPAIAVVRLNEKAMAFVIENGVARLRDIQIGSLIRVGYLEVLSGLRNGDEVVVYGQQSLVDGDPVDTNWRQWARRG